MSFPLDIDAVRSDDALLDALAAREVLPAGTTDTAAAVLGALALATDALPVPGLPGAVATATTGAPGAEAGGVAAGVTAGAALLAGSAATTGLAGATGGAASGAAGASAGAAVHVLRLWVPKALVAVGLAGATAVGVIVTTSGQSNTPTPPVVSRSSTTPGAPSGQPASSGEPTTGPSVTFPTGTSVLPPPVTTNGGTPGAPASSVTGHPTTNPPGTSPTPPPSTVPPTPTPTTDPSHPTHPTHPPHPSPSTSTSRVPG